jgi:hypothetical protein
MIIYQIAGVVLCYVAAWRTAPLLYSILLTVVPVSPPYWNLLFCTNMSLLKTLINATIKSTIERQKWHLVARRLEL